MFNEIEDQFKKAEEAMSMETRLAAELALNANTPAMDALVKDFKEIEENKKMAMEPFLWQRDFPIQRTPTVDEENYASEFHRRLVKRISDFDASLDNQHEVGLRLVNFGESIIFHVQDIGYWNPSLIHFYGETDNKEPVELIQHVSQISILLIKLPKLDPSKPKKPFGFQKES
jgi:hypothetical protein